MIECEQENRGVGRWEGKWKPLKCYFLKKLKVTLVKKFPSYTQRAHSAWGQAIIFTETSEEACKSPKIPQAG